MLSSDCTIFFARLEGDIDAYVRGAVSLGTEELSGTGNPSLRAGESIFKDCTEGHTSKKAGVVPAEYKTLEVC